jgi:hypothetical protein
MHTQDTKEAQEKLASFGGGTFSRPTNQGWETRNCADFSTDHTLSERRIYCTYLRTNAGALFPLGFSIPRPRDPSSGFGGLRTGRAETLVLCRSLQIKLTTYGHISPSRRPWLIGIFDADPTRQWKMMAWAFVLPIQPGLSCGQNSLRLNSQSSKRTTTYGRTVAGDSGCWCRPVDARRLQPTLEAAAASCPRAPYAGQQGQPQGHRDSKQELEA